MKKLVTEFVKIAQSGPTVDGRNIEASWLVDVAETYNLDTYAALIWPDHFKWSNAGKVVELKVEEKDGITSLYAKLQPNDLLLSYNKSGQKLYTSMELTDNFAESGKVYLTGLGVTDTPASLGTQELQFSQLFSHRKQFEKSSIYCCGVELPSEFKTEDSEEAPGWAKKLLAVFSASQSPNNEPETTEEVSEEMNAEQFKQLNDSLGNLSEQFAAMAKAMNPEEGKGQGEPDPKTKPEAEKPSKEFSQLSGQLTELVTTVKEFTTRLEQANPGTNVPETEGAAGEGGII